MALCCPSCRQTHPDLARFCGRCGRSLPQSWSVPPTLKSIQRPRPATGSSCCGWLFFFVCTLAFGGLCLTTGQRHQQRRFGLPERQSTALFELLEPEDVVVQISRTDCSGGLYVQGTKSEVEAVERFVRLLDGRHARRRFADEIREAQSYHLQTEKARSLASALQFSDAAMEVVGASEAGDRSLLRITARREDHRAIEGMIRILNGDRVGISSRCLGE